MKTKLLLFFVPFLFSLAAAAQPGGEAPAADAGSGKAKIFVRGRVLSSESGKPIPGVSVGIPDVATAITDDDGRFSLGEVRKGLAIEVRMSGFAYKEVVAGADGDVTIYLHDESFKTMYRQVGAPFGSKSFVETPYAVAAISNRENYRKAALSPESLIQDEVAGVNTLLRSGAQGAGGNMYMRGFSSINAGSQPMILIDGVPYENAMVTPSLISGNNITPLTGIDAKDIENITVLKDATSLYGSKGANGVILIETAKSQEQATKIDFHAYGGLDFAPATQYAMMNAWEYRSYLTEMLLSSGGYTSAQIQSLPYISSEKPVVQPWGVEGNEDYYRYRQETDWQKEIFQNGVNQNYYLSIKGGDNIALYALSVGYLNHDGIVKNTGFSRYATQFNSQINVLKMLKMSTNMSFTYGDRQLAYEGSLSSFNPLYVSLVKAPFMSPFRYNNQGMQTPVYEQADIFGVANPTALVGENSSVGNKTYRFFGNVGATLDLGKGFDLNGTFGVTFDKSRESIFLAKNGLYHDPLPSSEVTNEIQGLVSRFLQYYLDAHASYRREFQKAHSLSAHLGMRYQTNATEGDWIKAYNSSSDDLQSLGNGNLSLASMSGVLGGWKWMSLYFNGEYSYLKRYFVACNVALDASSRFGKEADGIKLFGNVFGAFPSVTAAWLASSEDFMRRLGMVDILKLRASYSISGNDDIGNYNTRTTYTSQNLFGYYGLLRANIANTELKWEQSAKLNVGLDLALLNERLSLSLDVYQTAITDLLTWKKGSEYYGIEQYAVNDGAMKNTGVDLSIQARVVNAAVKWDVGLNLSRYRNEVTDLSDGEKITAIAGANIRTKAGAPVGQFYGYKTDGVYATSAEAAAAGLNIQRGDGALIPFLAGDVRFVNLNGDNIIDEKDMAVIGDPNPDLFGSIVSKLQWKRWTLNAVITFSYGNDVYNALRANLEAMTGTENQTVAAGNRWSYEGHQTSTPKAVWGDPRGNARFSDRWIEDGSYIRLKSLSIAYDIPLRLNFIKGLQVYATGNNLLTFTKYLGYDPEFSAMQSPLYYGVDMGITPHPRAVMLGVKLGL
ncbi:MAG: SusC/RagA family TonB-linked outer membrane protein [Prevotellaceae bacterium]|jgi:TonB-linked SusC/RagA family outer membrane protein|nr:SusC/RagA family TonB-linked outer membrane protein [Prevotellaceae bacterium]